MRRSTAAIWLILFSMLITPLVAQTHATPVRDVDAVCAQCHAEIYRNYLSTPMANASGLAAEKLHAATFLHRPSSVQYKLSASSGSAVLTYLTPRPLQQNVQLPLNYFLGSGHLGTTYLYSVNHYLFESPIAWYAATQSLDMKPGLAEMQQAPPSLPMDSACLRCHMSGVQPSDAGTLNRYQNLPFLHTGITCEACHGDATIHTESQGRAPIVNPAKLSADRRDSVCISCHLEGDITVERAGHSLVNYRPGQSISDYAAYYVRTSANLTARGVSEVEQLSQSTCKRTSGERMSCSSCHDPHFSPSAEQRVAFYRNKCLACHQQPEFASRHHTENSDCTSCHMPRLSAQNIAHVAWTDHRILRLPEKSSPTTNTAQTDDFRPIFSPTATDRDHAMANYQAFLEGDRSLEYSTWDQLRNLRPAIDTDKEALDALAILSAERGESQLAEQLLRRVLLLDPTDLTALSNLGTLLAKEQRLPEAILPLRAAFDRNQDIPGLAMNLARVQCLTDDPAAAKATLKAALTYCPNCDDMRRLLAQMSTCSISAGK